MTAHRAWPSMVTAAVLLVLGALVATGVGQALGLSFTPAQMPPTPSQGGPVAPMTDAPAIARIGVPASDRLALAASAVADAVTDRGLPAPAVGQDDGDLTVRLV